METRTRIGQSKFYQCRLKDWIEGQATTAYQLSEKISMRSEIYRLTKPSEIAYSRDFAGQYNLDLICAYFPSAGSYIFDYSPIDGRFESPQLSAISDIKDWDGTPWDGKFQSHPLIRELRGEVERHGRHGKKPVFNLSDGGYYRSPMFRNNIGLLLCHLPDFERMFCREENSQEFNTKRCDPARLDEYKEKYAEIIYPQPFTRPYKIASKTGVAPPTMTNATRDPRYIPSVSILDKINAVLPYGSLVSYDPVEPFEQLNESADMALSDSDRHSRVDAFLSWVGKEPF